MPYEAHSDVSVLLGATHEGSAELGFHGIRSYDGPSPTGGGTVVIVRNELTQAWEAVVVDFEPQPPHRIAGIRLTRARPPAGVAVPSEPLTVEQARAELDAFLDRLTAADAFAGSVLLARCPVSWRSKRRGRAVVGCTKTRARAL